VEVHDDQLSGDHEEPLPVEVHDDQLSGAPEEPLDSPNSLGERIQPHKVVNC
jgi:hypothetical protein